MQTKDEFEFPDEVEAKKAASGQDKKDEEFEIEVLDDTPVEDQGRKPLDREVADPDDAELETYSEKVQKRIKDITHAKHDERRQKEKVEREKAELERMAQQLLKENQQLRGYVDTGSKQFVEQAQTLAETKVEKAKRALKEAQDSFDTEAIVAAQDALFDAKIEASEAKKFRPTSLQTQQDEVKPELSKPAAIKPDEKTLRWQARNQWFEADGFEEYTSFARGLHNKLARSGVEPGSDEYFEQIDARMKATFPEVFGTVERQQTKESSKKPTSVVAPATRSTGVKKIQLTATQVALAQRFGLTPQQYAAQVAKLENSND